MAWDRKVPFCSVTGRLREYVNSRLAGNWEDTEWKDNFVFTGALVYVGYERGRSAARLLFKVSGSGQRVHMFMSDFDDALRERGFTHGDGKAMWGEWTFCKRGQNYGCCMHKAD